MEDSENFMRIMNHCFHETFFYFQQPGVEFNATFFLIPRFVRLSCIYIFLFLKPGFARLTCDASYDNLCLRSVQLLISRLMSIGPLYSEASQRGNQHTYLFISNSKIICMLFTEVVGYKH